MLFNHTSSSLSLRHGRLSPHTSMLRPCPHVHPCRLWSCHMRPVQNPSPALLKPILRSPLHQNRPGQQSTLESAHRTMPQLSTHQASVAFIFACDSSPNLRVTFPRAFVGGNFGTRTTHAIHRMCFALHYRRSHRGSPASCHSPCMWVTLGGIMNPSPERCRDISPYVGRARVPLRGNREIRPVVL